MVLLKGSHCLKPTSCTSTAVEISVLERHKSPPASSDQARQTSDLDKVTDT